MRCHVLPFGLPVLGPPPMRSGEACGRRVYSDKNVERVSTIPARRENFVVDNPRESKRIELGRADSSVGTRSASLEARVPKEVQDQ